MKIRIFVEDGREKNNRPHYKGAPTVFVGNDAPVKAARYLVQKHNIDPKQIYDVVV